MTEQTLNSAQRQAIEDRLKAAVTQAIQQMQLRKWAMELAIGAGKDGDPVELARQIYGFTVADVIIPDRS